MNIIIITGASSGIGQEFALQMDSYFNNIDEFWLIARNFQRLEMISKRLKHKCRLFPMDITNEENMDLLEETAIMQNATVRMLINCAGYGVMGPFCEQSPADELGMIRLNCEALTGITHRLIPYMKKKSRIIQMASSAAFLPQADFAVYAATKSYVLSFSKALGVELKSKGIYVTAVCPGPVDTPFFEIAEATGSTLAIKKYTMVSPKEVVSLALRDSYKRHSMSVCSIPIKALWVFSKLVPHGIILQLMTFLKKKGL